MGNSIGYGIGRLNPEKFQNFSFQPKVAIFEENHQHDYYRMNSDNDYFWRKFK